MSEVKQMKFRRGWIQRLTSKPLTAIGYNVTLESTQSCHQFSVLREKFERLDMQEKFDNNFSYEEFDQCRHTINELGKFKKNNYDIEIQQNKCLQQNDNTWLQHNNYYTKHVNDYKDDTTVPTLLCDFKDDMQVYENVYYGCKHWNFFCVDDNIGVIILSLKMETLDHKEYVRLLIRSSLQSVYAIFPTLLMGVPSHCSDPYSWIDGLTQLLQLTKPLQLITHHTVGTELVKLDKVFAKTEFKTGVLYVKRGQSTEEDIFSNTSHSTYYDNFLDIIGDRVTLKGFTDYCAGLDTTNNLNGNHSIFTKYRNNSIMFHVSTMMPNAENDVKHLGKKRHIGNDVLCVVFMDEKDITFSPCWVRSQFIYSYIVVQVIDTAQQYPRYKVSIFCRNEVPWFGPCLLDDGIFEKGDKFRDWLLRKIINGDRACYKAPKFASMQQKTRSQIMNSIIGKEMNDNKTNYRSLMTPVSPTESIHSIFRDVTLPRIEDDDPKLRYFYNAYNEELSCGDVTFLAGKTYKRRIHGVSSVMCNKSRVFREMLTNWSVEKRSSFHEKEESDHSFVKTTLKRVRAQQMMTHSHHRKGKFALETAPEQSWNVDDNVETMSIKCIGDAYNVPIDSNERPREFIMNEFEADIFSGVIDYIHNDKCNITYETLPGLLCASTYYELPGLRMSCLNRADGVIDVEKVCPMLNIVEEYIYFKDGKDIQRKLLRFFVSNAKEIVEHNYFSVLSRSRMILVLCQDWKIDIECKVRSANTWAKKNDFQNWSSVAKSILNSSQISEEMLQLFVPVGEPKSR